MSTAELGEWSRYIISGAVAAYIVAWFAFSAELTIRSRIKAVSRELVGAVVGPDGGGARSSRDLGQDVPVGPVATTQDLQGSERLQDDDHMRAERMGRIGISVSILATLLLAAGVVARTLAVERAPWANMHEFSITGALVAALVFLAVVRTRLGRVLAVWLVLLLIVTLGLAVTILYVPPGPLVPALQSYWLVLHVGAAVVAFGLFTVAAVVSALQIAAERRGPGGVLPPAERLDRLAYRLIAIAFPIWTVGPLILGAIWAEVSWGRYWGWDPKEVWALITWLAYAAYLHARATAGWKGAKASVVSLIGYATVLFSYFAVNILFDGLHSYGGV